MLKSLLALIIVSLPLFGSTITLGTAASFGLLGGTISNTGTSSVMGNVGGMTSVTGFDPSGTQTGSVYSGGATLAAAYTAFENALNLAAADSPSTIVGGLTTSQDFIGGGVYAFSSTNVTSTAGVTLTFDAQSNSSAVFIMQIAGALTIDGPITFDLINGAMANNIYWVVGNTITSQAQQRNPYHLGWRYPGGKLHYVRNPGRKRESRRYHQWLRAHCERQYTGRYHCRKRMQQFRCQSLPRTRFRRIADTGSTGPVHRQASQSSAP
jgi:hypothetical protein